MVFIVAGAACLQQVGFIFFRGWKVDLEGQSFFCFVFVFFLEKNAKYFLKDRT